MRRLRMWRSTMLLSATKSVPQMASRISSRVTTRPPRLASRYSRLCSMPLRWTTDSPARTWRLRMSISISPSLIVGTIGRSSPVARRLMTIDRASSSSGEKGTVRMSSTPRSNALSFVFRSPRRVSPRTGRHAPGQGVRRAEPLEQVGAVVVVHVDDRHVRPPARRGSPPPPPGSRAARTTKRPWFSVSSIRSTTSGRSWSTSARRASSGRIAGMTDINLPRRSKGRWRSGIADEQS